MVVATMPNWLSVAHKPTPPHTHHTPNYLHLFFHDKSSTLGILSFDAGKTMSRLVSLYRSLTDHEISRLRYDTVRSEGVRYLNSRNETFLLTLACAERLEDLNHAATSVSRLGQNCSDFGLIRFDLVYSDMKLGNIGIWKLQFGSRDIAKLVDRMEKFVHSTAQLYSAMESLAEMESSERKLHRWKTGLDPKNYPTANLDYFEQKIASKRKEVKHLKETSLWSQTFDKTVGLMARLVCIVYARICTVFRPIIYSVPNPCIRQILHADSTPFFFRKYRNNFADPDHEDNLNKATSKSGPMPKTIKKEMVRFPSGLPKLIIPDDIGFDVGCMENMTGGLLGRNNRVYRLAPLSTVGGSGLSLRYANVILFAERCLHAPATIGEDARRTFYEMLPENLKAMVRAKLRRHWLKKEEEWRSGDNSLAEGWREALEEIMRWLGPLAHDTVRWQSERNLEKQKFDARPTALLMQTLHYSDLEKTEAAIVEVLVALSCIYRYEDRRACGRGRYG